MILNIDNSLKILNLFKIAKIIFLFLLTMFKGLDMEKTIIKRKKINMQSVLGATLLLVSSMSANAQQSVDAAPARTTISIPQISFTGATFDRIRTTGKIVVGTREEAAPFSYYVNDKPVGYTMDICSYIINDMKDKLNMPNLAIEYVKTSSSTRFEDLNKGIFDMECGVTANTSERRSKAEFSIPFFISPVKILARNDSQINSIKDLRGKVVAVSKSTNGVPHLLRVNQERGLTIKLLEEKSYAQAFKSLEAGRAQAIVASDVFIVTEHGKSTAPKNYHYLDDVLAVESFTLLLKKDDKNFKAFVDKSMINLITSGQINPIYNKWFTSPIAPFNKSLNMPASPLLKDLFRMPTDVVGN